MKCQRLQIARVRWQDHTRSTDVTTLTGLSPVSESIIRRRNSLFSHVTRLAEDTPAHQALRCHVDMTLGRHPDRSWRRHPDRPRNRWLGRSTNFMGTTTLRLLTCGDEPSRRLTWTSGADERADSVPSVVAVSRIRRIFYSRRKIIRLAENPHVS